MFKKSLFPIIAGLLLTAIAGCASDDRQYFNCEIQEVEETQFPEEVLTGEAIELEYPKFILFSVYDTLCFLYSWDNPGGFYNVHNLKNGKHLGYFCQRGQAPNESAGISPLFQFYTEDGHLKTDILTVNRTLTPWDITGSLSSGQTELDTVFRFNWSDVCIHPYRAYFRLPGDSILVFTQPDLPFNSTTATLPRIQIRTLADNKAVREYHLFTKPIEGAKKSDFRPDGFLLLSAGLKPDSKKAAITMHHFPQIIILDLVSGEAKGVRLKGKPGFSPDHERDYYMSIQCDEKYIYALYAAGQSFDKATTFDNATTVHVFDWDGHLARKIKLDHPASSLSLDPVSGMLYTMYPNQEEIYRYRINTKQ